MFRLANMPESDNESIRDQVKYISAIVSKTIYDALCQWVSTEDDIEEIYDCYFKGEDPTADETVEGEAPTVSFFRGIGQYFLSKGRPLSDEAAGKEILYRKISRMKEKMKDPEKYYTFDVFEEYIFVTLIEEAQSEFMAAMDRLGDHYGNQLSDKQGGSFVVDDTVRWIPLTAEEKKTADTLVTRFGYDSESAEKTALQIHRIHEMMPDEDEDDNMFFWDMDMEFLFEEGFVSGIRLCGGAEGAFLGYGYEYTENWVRHKMHSMPVVLGISATAERFNTLIGNTANVGLQKYVITADDVRGTGLLNDRIVITYPDDPTRNNDIVLLEAAVEEWLKKCTRWRQYTTEQHYSNVDPVLVVQVCQGSGGALSDTNLEDVLAKIEEKAGIRFKDSGQAFYRARRALSGL